MLLRNSISNSKKFFRRTIENFKSLLSKTSPYQRLQKSSPTDMSSKTEAYSKELDSFFVEFSHQWDSGKSSSKKKKKKKMDKDDEQKKLSSANCATKRSSKITYPEKTDGDIVVSSERREEVVRGKKRVRSDVVKQSGLCSRSSRERVRLVAEKLKELEGIDKGNVEYSLDVQEVLYYYSRLTCPVYLDIVDHFLKQLCSEIFSPQQFNSTPKLL